MPKETFDQEQLKYKSKLGLDTSPGRVYPVTYTVNWEVIDKDGSVKKFQDAYGSAKSLEGALKRAEWVFGKFPKSRIWFTVWMNGKEVDHKLFNQPAEWEGKPPAEPNMTTNENRSRIQRLFTQSILHESSSFKNIVALNEGDIKFLEEIGLYIMEGFKRDLNEIIKDASMESNLFENLKKQSQTYLDGQPYLYWNQPEEKDGEPVGYHLATIDKNRLKKGKVLRKSLVKERVILYLPILEDWITYYMGNNNEGLDRQLTLKCLAIPLQGQRMLKYVIVNGSREEISDEVGGD